MRRMDVPIASRWAHIALRDALLAKARAPRDVNPVDWAAERAWLLLRMGEADAARMLVAGRRYRPLHAENGAGRGAERACQCRRRRRLCPIENGIRKYDPQLARARPGDVRSLAGEPETASAQIDDARRHGRIGGIDLALAQKVVGAAGHRARRHDRMGPSRCLTAWRFGLAAATGHVPPDRLMKAARRSCAHSRHGRRCSRRSSGSTRPWSPPGLGVFSSQTHGRPLFGDL